MDRAELLLQIVEAIRPHPPEHHNAAALHYAGGDQALAQEALARLATPVKRREFAPGDRLGAYAIDREIGRGGMGVVYAARRADAELDLGQTAAARRDIESAITANREIADRPKASAAQLLGASQSIAFAPFPELRDLPAAKAYADRARELAPKDPIVHELTGRIAFLRGDAKEARQELELALQLLPPVREGDPPSRSRLGIQQLLDQLPK